MAKEITMKDFAALVNDYKILAKQMQLTIEKQNIMIEKLNNRIEELAENEQQELLSQKAFGKKIGKEYASIHRNLEAGLYETPEGYTKSAIEYSGHNNSAMLWYPLALKYESINKKARKEGKAA